MSTNSYIVVFKKPDEHPQATDDHIESLAQKVEQSGGSIKHRYSGGSRPSAIRGFAGEFSDDLKAEFEKNEAVKYVEPDGSVTTQ
ncbi:hypothetical protein ACM66B_004691 [Microbotryomycetes sp. NB124-2]